MEFGVDLKCFETPVMLPEPVMYSIFLTQESDLDKSTSLSCDCQISAELPDYILVGSGICECRVALRKKCSALWVTLQVDFPTRVLKFTRLQLHIAASHSVTV